MLERGFPDLAHSLCHLVTRLSVGLDLAPQLLAVLGTRELRLKLLEAVIEGSSLRAEPRSL